MKTRELSIQITTFFMQKLGNKPNEYEDSFCFDLEKRKFGIADGASESCFAKMWANLLTEFFVKSDLSLFSLKGSLGYMAKEALRSFLFTAQEELNKRIDWETLPWYVEEKARRGEFATFLGFEVKKEYSKGRKSYRWRAISVGDCCLFHVNNKRLIDSFPLQSSAQFGSTPSLLSSRSSPNLLNRCEIRGKKGEVSAEEMIILATDSVAKWIIQEEETGEHIWWDLIFLEEGEMRSFFEELIKNKEMRNDDITILKLNF